MLLTLLPSVLSRQCRKNMCNTTKVLPNLIGPILFTYNYLIITNYRIRRKPQELRIVLLDMTSKMGQVAITLSIRIWDILYSIRFSTPHSTIEPPNINRLFPQT